MAGEDDVALDGGGAAGMLAAADDGDQGSPLGPQSSSSEERAPCGKRAVPDSPDSPVLEEGGGEKRRRREDKASGECQTLASFKVGDKVDLAGVETMMMGVPCVSNEELLLAARADRFVPTGDADGHAKSVGVQTDTIDTRHLAAKEDARCGPLPEMLCSLSLFVVQS